MNIKELYRTNQLLLFIGLVITALYIGSGFFIPLAFAFLFATLVLPVSKLLENKLNFGRTASSLVSTLLIFLTAGLLIWLMIHQMTIFVNDIAQHKGEIVQFIQQLQEKIAANTGLDTGQQKEIISNNSSKYIEAASLFATSIIAGSTGSLGSFLLMLVYVFLFLLYRKKMFKFIMMYVADDNKEEAARIISETSSVAHSYLWGRIQVIILLAIMYTITFYAYGLEHAGILILFGSIITIVPYVGPLLSAVLPVAFIIIFDHPLPSVISFAVIVFVIQLIESYIMEPVIIGSEVKQNPLFIIIAIILGGVIWVLPGLILFVPFFAILKIFFDHSAHLKPVRYLMGYEGGISQKEWMKKIKGIFKKD